MKRTIAIALSVSAFAVASGARAEEPIDTTLVETSLGAIAAPPPLDIPYLQYGVAFTTELVASAGQMCANPEPCILGSGGGVVVRVGRRAAGPWYFGGAYELSKQDPGSLYRFATLQQARGEARWYYATGLDTQPFATITAGVAAYGNEWGVDTYGPMGSIGIGVESQLSRRAVVGVTLSYRIVALREFVDSSGFDRATSIAQLIGLDVSLEERDPLQRTP